MPLMSMHGFELILIRGSRLISAESRGEFKRNLRIVLQPLVDLELKRRAGKGIVEDDFWDDCELDD